MTLIVGGIVGFYIKSNFFNMEESERVEYITNNQNTTPINKLEENIIKKGDINSYIELRTLYIDKDMFTFLPWALIMANKYHNKDGYFDVYACLFDMNCQACTTEELESWSLTYLDSSTKEFAIEYLKKASDLGHQQAKDVLEIYKKKVTT
jgi:hypothetical protein